MQILYNINTLWGDDLKLKNKLTQKAIAKECVEC